jgi:hypothetical protein
MESKRPELFSTSLTAGSRTCFFDVKESVNGSKYLKITEARRDPEGEFEHSRVMVYEEHVDQFLRSVSRAVQFITEGGKAGTSLERIRCQYPNAYARWSDEDDRLLGATSRRGKTIAELAAQFGRQPGAIESRLRKLGLVEATESGVVEHEG